MKIVKIIWKVIIGGLVTTCGFFMVGPQFQETALTGSAVVGVAILAVGISVLADAFN